MRLLKILLILCSLLLCAVFMLISCSKEAQTSKRQPVITTSFDAEEQSSMSQYYIEISDDQKVWIILNNIPATKNSTEHYESVDPIPICLNMSGSSIFHRIRAEDIDGKSTIYPVKLIKLE